MSKVRSTFEFGSKSLCDFGGGALFLFERKRAKKKQKAFRFTISAAGNYVCDRSPQCFHFAKAQRNHAVGFKARIFCFLQREATKPKFCAYLLQKINGFYSVIKRGVPSNFCIAKIRSGSEAATR